MSYNGGTKYSDKGKKILLHFYIIIIRLHTMIYKKALLISIVCIAATIPLVSLNIASSSPIQMNSPSYLQVFAQDQEVHFKVQNTSKSMQDPLPGHEMHQVVIAAPPRSDGKIYSGLVTFTASVPVEVIVFDPFKLVTTTTQADLLPFEGAALTFHQSDGKLFTVDYTINATVKPSQP
jgi:hypothetical protein